MKADNRKNRICRALHSNRPAVWLLGLAVLTLATAGEKSEFNFSGDGSLVWFYDGGES